MAKSKPALVIPSDPAAKPVPEMTTEQFAAWRLFVREARIPGLEMMVITTPIVLAVDAYLAALEADNDSLRGHQ